MTAAVTGGSLLIAAALLLRLTCGRRLPRTAFPVLWGCAALRLLLPVRLPSPLSVWNLLSNPPAAAALPHNAAAALPHTAAGLPQAAHSAAVSGPAPLAVIWMAGTAALALYFLLVWLRSLAAFRRSEPWAPPMAADPETALRRSVRVRLSRDRRAPLTYGILRPVILIPPEMAGDGEALRWVLAHELTHIRRFDCLLKLMLTAALCLHWWNPLVWLMTALAGRDIELACDDQVLRRAGRQDRAAYASVLLDLAARGAAMPQSCGFGRNGTEVRIQMILKDRPARGKVTAGLLLAAVLVLGLVSVFGTQPAAAEPGIVLAAAPADGQIAPDWVWPLERSDETSLTMTFGEHVHPVTGAVTNHHGVDLAAPAGSEIRAVRAGTVTEAGFDPVYGNRVVIDHGDGYVTTYGHCQRLDVAAGDSVAQGDVIAAVGSTGWSTGPHLHFGAALDGTDVDPLTLLPQI